MVWDGWEGAAALLGRGEGALSLWAGAEPWVERAALLRSWESERDLLNLERIPILWCGGVVYYRRSTVRLDEERRRPFDLGAF